MLDGNALLFILLQFGSRFANSFLVTAARYELLEASGVAKFASAQVATSVARMVVSQVAGVLTDNFPLKAMYVSSEGCHMALAAVMLICGHGHSNILFAMNVFLGLIFAFSQPVTKSMPPTIVAEREDLAMLNGWDLTCDKVGRYLAPLAYAVMSSSFDFRAAVLFSFVLYAMLTLLRTQVRVRVRVVERRPRQEAVGARLLGLGRQVWEGVVSLRRDRVLGLLILNTLVTNIFLYPLNAVCFPVLFKQVAAQEESAGAQLSLVGSLLACVTSLIGVHKKKAWMNYTALVSLGGVVGPICSNFMIYSVERYAAHRRKNDFWVGLNFGIMGQIATSALLAGVIASHHFLETGVLVLVLVLSWVVTVAVNNVVTTYFNSLSQQRLKQGERGRFIANIMTVFTLGNSLGTLLFGWVLSHGDTEVTVTGSVQLLCAGLAAKLLLLGLLRSSESAVDDMGSKGE